jgi:hypothetical protein
VAEVADDGTRGGVEIATSVDVPEIDALAAGVAGRRALPLGT